MDTNTALLGTGTGGTIITMLFFIYRTFNHKRCRSRCCGNDMDLSLDIENTTPPQERFEVNNPLPLAVVVR
jgi:hypothetical protein